MVDIPKSTPVLRFDAGLPKKYLDKIRDNVSAIVLNGDHLWLGGDEGTSIHRMTLETSRNFGDHTSFDLFDTLKLPGPAKEEIDIEGLDVDGGYLWLIGSHSAKRKKADKDVGTAENLQRRHDRARWQSVHARESAAGCHRETSGKAWRVDRRATTRRCTREPADQGTAERSPCRPVCPARAEE